MAKSTKQPEPAVLQRQWAEEMLYLEPAGEVELAEMERSFLMWCSDRRYRAKYTGLTKLMAEIPSVQRKLRPTRFIGLGLRPPVDSGYRVKTVN